MPELPEVETIVRTLEKSLLNEKVVSLEFLYPQLLESDSPFNLNVLLHKRFVSFDRRGKFLNFGFEDDYHLIVHLRMEGKFHLYKEEITPTKHTHLIIQTESHWIHYLDVRKFSRMAVTQDPNQYFIEKNLGLEPFVEELTWQYLKGAMSKSTRSIKSMLLDQSIVTGIGNIYCDEILFDTKIHPLKKGTDLRNKDYKALVEAIPRILKRAISAGGTTIRSYTSALDVSGRFQISLKAYGQEGKPCAYCERPLTRIKVSGRSTVFCERCQK